MRIASFVLALMLTSLACTLGVAPAERAPLAPVRVGALPLSALTPAASPTATRAVATPSATQPPAPSATSTETVTPSPTRTTVTRLPPSPTPFGGASGFAYHSGPVDGEKFIQFFDGTTAISLTTGISPAWSPDGSRLAFLSNRAGNWDVFVINADGSGVTQLTDTQRNEDAPAWSPDGRFIVFSSERDGNAEIYRMAADGTDVARLTNAPLTLDIQPAYSPDGARLAYVAIQNGVGRLFVMNSDGSNPQPLNEGEGDSRFPAWSPDGQRLVFASDRVSAGVFELYELTLATSAVRALTNSGTQNGSPHYAPDGRHILFDSNRDGNYDVYRLNLETLGVTALTRSERPLFNGDPSWRP